MKHTFFLCVFLVFLVSCNDIDQNYEIAKDYEESSTIPQTPGIGKARDISSFDLVAEMGIGWNLGNSFDVKSRDKTFWNNPLPSRAIIDAVSNMGFKTLRIPITWQHHQEGVPPYEIEAAYLNDVQAVVDYGFENKMHVIIDVHHDNQWLKPASSEASLAKVRLGRLWTQVAEHFKTYNDSLIFEVLNEPRLEESPEEWSGGTSEGRDIVNQYHKVALEAIRATGENNSMRHVMIPTYAASTVTAAMNDLVIPNNDSKVIISLHTYFPWNFAGLANTSWGSNQDKLDLQAEFDRIRNKWIVENKRPVILGEWGTISDNVTKVREEYADFYVKNASERGLLTIVWDDGGMFKLLDRNSRTWEFSEIAEKIVAASN